MNVAYKHLDSRLRIAELTIGQWAAAIIGLLIAIGWGSFLSPFGSYLTLFTAVYLGALPVGAAFLSGSSDLDVALMLRSAVRWSRSSGRYVPGPGRSARGYVVHGPPVPEPSDRPRTFDLEELWDR